MKNKYLLIVCITIISLFSCEKQKAIVPGFLKIDDVVLQATAIQGSSSDRITDINVFINDQSIGIFELPALIPIQQTGNVNLKIRSIIYKNGQSNEKVDYPFYTTFSLDTIFVPEVQMEITPVVKYQSSAIFDDPWSGEDFEAGVNFYYSALSDTVFQRITNPADAFEGASGLAYLSESMDFFEAWSPTFSNIPRNGVDVWLEMDYKSTHQFAISVYINGTLINNQRPIVFFNPRVTYGKVYVELNSVFSTLSGAFNYTLAIGFPKQTGEVAQFHLDNVKLVRF
tara:strand:- start:17312 stop:18163 length:852 start_codon:yes stop_codon:yes gene_type:complete